MAKLSEFGKVVLDTLNEANDTIGEQQRELDAAKAENAELRERLKEEMAKAIGAELKNERLTEALRELRETISPGRVADAEYYLNVAKKMRARELEIRPK